MFYANCEVTHFHFFTDSTNSTTSDTQSGSEVPKIIVTVIFFVFIVVTSFIVSRLVNRYIENRKIGIEDLDEVDKTDIIVRSRLAYMQRKRSTIVRKKIEMPNSKTKAKVKAKEKKIFTTPDNKMLDEIVVNSPNESTVINMKSIPKMETKNKLPTNRTLQPIFELSVQPEIQSEMQSNSDEMIKTATLETGMKKYPVESCTSNKISHLVSKQTSGSSPKHTPSLVKSKTTLILPKQSTHMRSSFNIRKSNTQ